MKCFVFLCTLCTLLSLISYSTQIPQYNNCTEEKIRELALETDCLKVTCLPPGEGVELEPCPVLTCAIGAQVGYRHGDPTKQFPECCSTPICKS